MTSTPSFPPGPWVGIISDTSLVPLGRIRTIANLEAARGSDWLWVRNISQSRLKPEEELLVNTVPWQERYQIVDEVLLRPLGSLIPTARLPRLSWSPLIDLLKPTLSRPLFPGKWPAPLPHPVSRSMSSLYANQPEWAKPEFLLVSSENWLHFAETAPELRLKQLKFAQAARRFCLVGGQPLPPIPGTYLYQYQQSLWPAGNLPHETSTLIQWNQYLELGKDELALIHSDGTYELIPVTAWVPASRSAARLSVQPKNYA